MQERLRLLLGETVWWLGEHLLKIKVEGKENLDLARKHLEAGSLLVYFNHISFLDPGLVLRLILENLNPPLRPAAFASQKHLDEKRGKVNWLHSSVMKGVANLKGVNLLPIIQEYDRSSYPNWADINFCSIRKAVRILSAPGGIVIIAPEESRSKTGALKEAKEGIEVIFKTKIVQEKTLAWPMGVIGAEKIHQSGKTWLNPFAPVTLVVNKPLSYEEVKNDAETLKLPIKDVLMLKLAQRLPENYRGFYSPSGMV